MKNMRQLQLQANTVVLTAWVEDEPGIKVGNIITLKDEPYQTLWTIKSVGRLHPASDIKRGWNNNI